MTCVPWMKVSAVQVVMTVVTVASSMAFGTSLAAQCVTVDPVVPAVRVDPLDATGAAQVMQPVTMTARRARSGSGPVRVTYQIVDEDSTGPQRVGITADPQLEWRSGDSGPAIGASRSKPYALLRSEKWRWARAR